MILIIQKTAQVLNVSIFEVNNLEVFWLVWISRNVRFYTQIPQIKSLTSFQWWIFEKYYAY